MGADAPLVIYYWRDVWRPLRRAVIDRDGGKCVACGTRDNLTVHHKKPRWKGGKDKKNNLITCCRRCHDIAEQLDAISERARR